MPGRSARYCTQCGASVSGTRYCPQCGTKVAAGDGWGPGERMAKAVGEALTEHQLGALAYLTPIPALALLLFEPYRHIRFVRFHCYQCLFLTLAAMVTQLNWAVLPIFGGMLALAAHLLLLAVMGMWCLAAYMAWHGKEFRLPLLGTFAAQHAAQS